MAWYTTDTILQHIAEDDIVVKKVVEPYKRDGFFYKSPFYTFYWTLESSPKIDLSIRRVSSDKGIFRDNIFYIIYRGYYALNPKMRFETIVNSENMTVKGTFNNVEIFEATRKALEIVDMIIPKGSEWYENKYGEIISSSLKIK
jgi:hypothetical protein